MLYVVFIYFHFRLFLSIAVFIVTLHHTALYSYMRWSVSGLQLYYIVLPHFVACETAHPIQLFIPRGIPDHISHRYLYFLPYHVAHFRWSSIPYFLQYSDPSFIRLLGHLAPCSPSNHPTSTTGNTVHHSPAGRCTTADAQRYVDETGLVGPSLFSPTLLPYL